jgi:glycerate dehydrogenase
MMMRAVFLDFATMGPGISTAKLDALVNTQYFDHTQPEAVAQRIRGADIVIVNKVALRRSTLAAADRLRMVVLAATGTDNVDLDAARARGIGIANIRDYCTPSVAQHVMGLILALTHHLPGYHQRVRDGAWGATSGFCLFDFPIRELTGLTLGIVGMGSLGSAVGRLAEAFGMVVKVAQRPGSDQPAAQDRLPLAALLRAADVLTLHCPLTAATHHLIGPDQLRQMKSDALLINTARGALVDTAALAMALRDGVIAGAGIDVLPQEPPVDGDPLLAPDIPNLILTPHTAWAARESRQRGMDQVSENVAAFLSGTRLRRVL